MKKISNLKSKKIEARNKLLELRHKEKLKSELNLKRSIESLYSVINDQEKLDIDKLVKQIEILNRSLNFDKYFHGLEKRIDESKVELVTVKDFGDLLRAVESNKPIPVDLSSLEKAIISVEERVRESIVPDKQFPEDYKPFRRVVKMGNKLIFDDQPTPSRGGGGSSGSSGSSAPPTPLAFVTSVTTAGTRVQLASNTVTQGFILQAPSTNSGIIYVGGSNVSSTVYGAELQAGQSTSIYVDNTDRIYIDSSVNGDKCACLGS